MDDRCLPGPAKSRGFGRPERLTTPWLVPYKGRWRACLQSRGGGTIPPNPINEPPGANSPRASSPTFAGSPRRGRITRLHPRFVRYFSAGHVRVLGRAPNHESGIRNAVRAGFVAFYVGPSCREGHAERRIAPPG